MALTPELIKANESLASLSDDQIAAISTLSVNDENKVIGEKIGEVHGKYDQDIEEITGQKKPDGVKTYDFVKQVLGEFKTKATSAPELQKQIDTYKTKVSDLEKQIADGKGNEAIAQKLRDAEGKLSQLQTQYATDKQTWEKEKGTYAEQITGLQVTTQFEKASAGLKFKAGYPESVQKTLIDTSQANILVKYKPDWVEADGKKVMVFRDDKGEIIRNKNNQLNPYTAEELMKENLKEVLDLGKKTTGAGTKNPAGGDTGTVDVVDIAGAKTQIEADELIVKHLMQIGETRGSASFAEKQKKLRTDNGVDKLPLR